MNKKIICLVISFGILLCATCPANAVDKQYTFNKKRVSILRNGVTLSNFTAAGSSFGFDGTLIQIRGKRGKKNDFSAVLIFEGNNLYASSAEYIVEVVQSEADIPADPVDNRAYLIFQNTERKKGSTITRTFSTVSQGIGRVKILKLTAKNVTISFSFKGVGVNMTIDPSDIGADDTNLDVPNEKVNINSKLKINYLKANG